MDLNLDRNGPFHLIDAPPPLLLRVSLRIYALRIKKIRVSIHNPPWKKDHFVQRFKKPTGTTYSEISPTYPSLPLGIPTPSIEGAHVINGMAKCRSSFRTVV